MSTAMHTILRLEDIEPEHRPIVGGKAANLAELMRLEGITVPSGFCITTHALQPLHGGANELELSRRIVDAPIDTALSAQIGVALAQLGDVPVAVRSSSPEEDLPSASFAGQYDTFLNVRGLDSVLVHVRRCWASLFSERAIAYRQRHGFDHHNLRMAVIVQRLVVPHASGALFTADPVTSNRTITSIEAVPGLGESLVSGLVTPEVFSVRDGQIIARTQSSAPFALVPAPGGGTAHEPRPQGTPTLTDVQVLGLEQLGRRLEAHFGCPQDIEWALADDGLHILQSRPITTLFPIPVQPDAQRRVYVSVGHGQMMTEAMTPLGRSFYQLCAGRPMADAGGRLFVDVTLPLASPALRPGLLETFGRSDPLLRDALETIVARDGFLPSLAGAPPTPPPAPPPLEPDPSIVQALVRSCTDSLATAKREIDRHEGSALIDFISTDVQELRRLLLESHRAIMTAMESTWWLADHLDAWLGEKHAADPLARAAPFNVSAALGLELLDVADVIRRHPEVIAFLERATDDGFLDELPSLPGGLAVHEALLRFLDVHGMRCVGEVDLGRPRWSERPSTLLPVLLGNVHAFTEGEAARRIVKGHAEAERAEAEILRRLRALPDGEAKANETKQAIDRLRTFIGYREFPKYGMVSRLFIYKRALLAEADRLVRDHVLRDREDVFFLRFEELRDVVNHRRVDPELIRQRRDELRAFQSLRPPRVLTSEGETLSGRYHRITPEGALVGLPVSSGVVEGRARVLRGLADAALEPGDILVTTATDPSWTPVFVAIAGLVTEVGGVMTHGSVIAREYGVPAVVGVAHATDQLRDGQRIRVNGTEGLVEILSS